MRSYWQIIDRTLRTLGMVFLLMNISVVASAQCSIWFEDFSTNIGGSSSPVIAGDVMGNDNQLPVGPDWTSGNCLTCSGNASDWWEVRSSPGSNHMSARDVNGEVVFLRTEIIDISTYPSVDFSVLCTEVGDHEGLYLNTAQCAPQSNEDYVDISYSIDGGPFVLISNYLGWCGLYGSCSNAHTFSGDDGTSGDCRSTDADWGSQTVGVTGLVGSTLQILIEATNSAGSEYIRFDDICVEETPVLPIELVSFSARAGSGHVDLEWSTASELNNDLFTVERSMDEEEFQAIGYVQGAGNSNTQIDYFLRDDHPLMGVSYYRLKQTDIDGTYTYSEIKAVQINSNSNTDLFVWSDQNDLQIEHGIIGNVDVEVRDVVGRLLFSRTLNDVPSKIELELPASINKGQILILGLYQNGVAEVARFYY